VLLPVLTKYGHLGPHGFGKIAPLPLGTNPLAGRARQRKSVVPHVLLGLDTDGWGWAGAVKLLFWRGGRACWAGSESFLQGSESNVRQGWLAGASSVPLESFSTNSTGFRKQRADVGPGQAR
jgi:hypothetical protein